MNGRILVTVALILAGAAFGVFSVSLARGDPGYSFAGASAGKAAVELAAG